MTFKYTVKLIMPFLKHKYDKILLLLILGIVTSIKNNNPLFLNI